MSAAQQLDEEQDPDLGDQLFNVQNHTLDRDRARGRITDVDDDGGTIVVHYSVLTTDQETQTEFEKPATWTTRNQFVRLVEWCGYNSASAMQLEGEEVPVRYEGEDSSWDADAWEIDIDRMPGEGILDRADYYNGAFKGVLGGLFIAAATVAPHIIGITLPLFSPMSWSAILAFAAAIHTAKFVYTAPEDGKRPLSNDELEVEMF